MTADTVKHTPGPWHVDPKAAEESFFEDVNILRQDGLAVAVALHNGDIFAPEPEANARLIAAAPDLLEAAKHSILALEIEFGRSATEVNFPQLYAAIARAEGRS